MLDQIELKLRRVVRSLAELYRRRSGSANCTTRSSGTTARPEAERNHSRRLRAQAESQIRLLTEAEGIYEGDFYSYRYFAAEGFLPGYNFPRLPLSAYVPGRGSEQGTRRVRLAPALPGHLGVRAAALDLPRGRALPRLQGEPRFRFRRHRGHAHAVHGDDEALSRNAATRTSSRASISPRCATGAAPRSKVRIGHPRPRPAPEREPEARAADHLRRGGAPALRLQARHRRIASRRSAAGSIGRMPTCSWTARR